MTQTRALRKENTTPVSLLSSKGYGRAAPVFRNGPRRFCYLPVLFDTTSRTVRRQLELCGRTSRDSHPSEELSKLRTGVSLWADGIMAGAACQGCLGLSGYRSAPYLAVL